MTQEQITHETDQSASAEELTAAPEGIRILHIYLKGIHMSQPNSPGVLSSTGTLKMDMQLNVAASQLSDSTFEVCLRGSIQTRSSEDLAVYEIEVEQAGLFDLQAVPESDFGTVIGVQCTHLLYPYLRSYVADTVTRAGFVPLHLGEVNFAPVVLERKPLETDVEQAA